METIELIHKMIANQDSLEIGTPAKGGCVKIYGDYNKDDEFKAKVDKAVKIRSYALSQLGG